MQLPWLKGWIGGKRDHFLIYSGYLIQQLSGPAGPRSAPDWLGTAGWQGTDGRGYPSPTEFQALPPSPQSTMRTLSQPLHPILRAIRGLEMTKGNMLIHSASQHTARDTQHWTKRPAEPQHNLNPRTSDANVLVLNASCWSNLYITKCPQLMEILLTDHTHQGDEGMKVTAPNSAKRPWTLT